MNGRSGIKVRFDKDFEKHIISEYSFLSPRRVLVQGGCGGGPAGGGRAL